MKRPTLASVAVGTRVRLPNGRVVDVTGPTKESSRKQDAWRFVREYLGDYEWLPGKWGARLGDLEIIKGNVYVEVV